MKDEALVEILRQKDKIREDVNSKIGKIKEAQHISLRDFTLFHIEELTFEEDSPRKEALENVLSSLIVDGVNFVYMLIGDANGVSFYFGIVKDKNYKNTLALDVDDMGKIILKPSIEGNFRGSKIVEQKKDSKKAILDKLNAMTRFARVDGVPSVNEDNEDFQGVDRLVDVMMGDEFCVMILADPLSAEEVQEIEDSLYDIYNKLSPVAKISIQESVGESVTKGTSKTENESTARGENKSTSTSNGEQKQYKSTSEGASEGKSNTETVGKSETKNQSITANTGTSKNREHSDKVLNEWMEYIDEILLKRVAQGRSKGIFNAGIYLLANQKGTLLKLGNTIKSLFFFFLDNKAPLKFTYISNKDEINSIKNLQLPTSELELVKNMQQARLLFSKNSNKIASWMSTNELSVISGLPQKEVVGLPLREEVEFGLNIKNKHIIDDDKLLLGSLVRSGNILNIEVNIDRKNLNKHTFITGVTGSGKTTTCQRILQSANIPFMVIEPAKTEYRVLTKKYEDMLVFTLGDDSVAPFRLNPFEFFKGENITSRVDMIKANIEAAFDMEAAIPQIIESALYKCYEEYGWDIVTSTNETYEDPFADGVFSFPTLSDLIKQTVRVVEEQGFDDRLKNDYIGSIKARLQGLLVGSKGFMLNTPRSIDFTDLIERNVILELEEIKNGAEKSLIMGFVLINLNEAVKLKYQEYKKLGKNFKHISLVEEAHRLLSKHTPSDNPSKKLGVETFTDMLAEVRKYGESLIIVDQIPDKLTPEVLKNTNTKIVHKLFASDDKNAIGNTMALSDEQKEFLSNLEAGRAIVSSQDFAKPLQVQIKELEDISTTTSTLVEPSDIRKIALKYYQKKYRRGIIQGLELFETEPSLSTVEEFLGRKINIIEEAWNSLCSGDLTKEFTFNFTEYLEKSNLLSKQELIVDYLLNKFYKHNTKEEKLIIKKHIQTIISTKLQDKSKFSRTEKCFLRIR